MEVSIIKIGNSKGIRFSKTILEKYNIRDKVSIIPGKDHIIIKPFSEPRKGWEESFKKMNETGIINCLLMIFLRMITCKNGDESIPYNSC